MQAEAEELGTLVDVSDKSRMHSARTCWQRVRVIVCASQI